MNGVPELPALPDLTPREAARRLGTSVATVWAMIADGRLVSYRLSSRPGGARRIRHEAVEAIRRGVDPVEAVRAADDAIAKRVKTRVSQE